jgi:hypothetical protein
MRWTIVANIAASQDILIYGSSQLVSTLTRHNLIDEYRLMIHPVVLGGGKPLFRNGHNTAALRLADNRHDHHKGRARALTPITGVSPRLPSTLNDFADPRHEGLAAGLGHALPRMRRRICGAIPPSIHVWTADCGVFGSGLGDRRLRSILALTTGTRRADADAVEPKPIRIRGSGAAGKLPGAFLSNLFGAGQTWPRIASVGVRRGPVPRAGGQPGLGCLCPVRGWRALRGDVSPGRCHGR